MSYSNKVIWLHRKLCTVCRFFLFVGSKQSIGHVHVEPNISSFFGQLNDAAGSQV